MGLISDQFLQTQQMKAMVPEHIEVLLAKPCSAEEFHQELGTRFAIACQELGAKLLLEPADLADAYADPKAFDATGSEIDLDTNTGLDDAMFPITFRFEKLPDDMGVEEGRVMTADLATLEEEITPIPAEHSSKNVVSPESEVAELVLECMHNDGIDVQSLPIENRTIVFPFDSTTQEYKIGRLHQPGFFELLIPREDRLLSISRTHFLIRAFRSEPGSDSSFGFTLNHESKNPLKLDNFKSVHQYDEVRVGDGTWIGFRDCNPGEGPFLVMRLRLRTQGTVLTQGSLYSVVEGGRAEAQKHKSASVGVAQTSSFLPLVPPANAPVAATLDCFFVVGQDVDTMPLKSRRICIPLGMPVQIGRQCQLGFFEHLLKYEPQWLNYMSGNHCELTLSSVRSWWGFGAVEYSLAVENYSKHMVHLDQKILAREEWDELPEGGTLAFTAEVDGLSMTFMQFRLSKSETQTGAATMADGGIMCNCMVPDIGNTFVKIDEGGI